MPPQGAAGPGAASLEDRVGLFDSIGNSIDSLVGAVKAVPSLIKEAAYYTYYSAKATVGLSAGVAIAGGAGFFMPHAGISELITNIALKGYQSLILPVGMAIGTWLSNLKNKAKTTFKQISNELSIGGILGGLLHYTFVGNTHLGNIVGAAYGTKASLAARGAYSLATLPLFIGTHECLNRAMMKDYKPQPLKDIGKRIKKMWPIIPPIIANYTIIPEYLGPAYNMPTAAGISVAYGLLKSEKKKEEKKEEAPAPYGLPPGYAMPKAA